MQFDLRPSYSRFIYLALMLFLSIALIPAALAKSGLSPIADLMEKMYGKGNYSCNITDNKATCTSSIAKDLDSVRLDNLAVDASLAGNRATFSAAGMLRPKGKGDSAEDKAMQAMLPRMVKCTFDMSLGSSLLNQEFSCKAKHDPYDMKIKFYIDFKHKSFSSTSRIEEAVDLLKASEEKLPDELFIRIKRIEIEIDSTQPRLSEAIYAAVSAYETSLTKGEYESSVALSASMVPIFLARSDKLDDTTKESISAIGFNLGEIVLAKKKYLSIAIKNKLKDFVSFAKFKNFEQDDLLALLNQSEITVKSR